MEKGNRIIESDRFKLNSWILQIQSIGDQSRVKTSLINDTYKIEWRGDRFL